MKDLKKLEKEAKKAIREAVSEAVLKDAEKAWLGRKGTLTLFLRGLKSLSQSERKTLGSRANKLKAELEKAIKQKKETLLKEITNEGLAKEWVDVTLPGKKGAVGRPHPLGVVVDEIISIFEQLGFSVAQGPEVESEWYNFDALNIPDNHPSRDLWDTFWLRQSAKSGLSARPDLRSKSGLGQKLLLRTHTSPVQIRYMEKNHPPFKIISLGKVFRYEATDASHDIEFYQLEGLMVDTVLSADGRKYGAGENISVAHLKYVIKEFFERFFQKTILVRLRPSFFPFVEPGFEVDITCVQCEGLKSSKTKKCSVCKGSGWLEIAGAGMVHPQVFRNAGHNPLHLQGFAFGFGVDRLAMIKYKIPDIRLFHSTDPRFLKQF